MSDFTASDEAPLAPFAIVPACQRCGADADWFPAVDILEDNEEYLFIIDLPNVQPENIRVFLEGQGLFLSGERTAVSAADKKCLRIERPQGHFERRFALPDDVNRTEIESSFQDGILELHVRKMSSGQLNPATNGARPKLRLRPAA